MPSFVSIAVVFLSAISAVSFAQIQPIPTFLNEPPPDLITTDISPECVDINNGTLLCCDASLAGDQPEIEYLAAIEGYPLPVNDVNGIGCKSELRNNPSSSSSSSLSLLV
jgi:hypothetical protein